MLMAILKIMVCANAIYNFSFNLNALKDADKNSEDYIGYHILCIGSVITTVATILVCWKG